VTGGRVALVRTLRSLLLAASASAVLASAAGAAGVLFGGDVAGLYRARPASIHITSDQNIVHIHWSSWGGPKAHAKGTLQFSVADHTAPVSLRIELSNIHKCGSRRQYLRLAYRDLSGPDRGHLSVIKYTCRSPF
jgi:hypothetical protein